MAQGGHNPSGFDEEESEDIEDFTPLPFMDPIVAEFKKQGDENFRGKLYTEALVCYTLALNHPILPFMDTSIISEKLFRKRAVCFFKMGKYLEAIHDSERAIEVADRTNNRNLAKSVFIKMKAIVCLEDYVPAFPVAVWCKHLRPNCETTRAALNDLKEKLKDEFRKDNSTIDEVLFTMLKFAEEMSMDHKTRELALECYTELMDLIDFLYLPVVRLRQSECLLHLGRCNEAKDVCAEVLWFGSNEKEALSLMSEITRQIKEGETKTANEMVESQATASFSLEKCEENNDALLSTYAHKERELEVGSQPNTLDVEDTFNATNWQQSAQGVEEVPLLVAVNEVQEKMAHLDQAQVGGVPTKEQGNKQKKRKKNREKKMKKKAKKKAQKKNEGSSNQAPVSNVTDISPDESPDENDSQATDSLLGDPDISFGYFDFNNTVTSPSTFNASEVDGFEESDGGDFVPVRNTRRPLPMAASKTSLDSPKQFGERVSSLDWIGSSGENSQLSDYAVSTQPKSKTVEKMLHPSERKSPPFSGAATTVENPPTAANVKPPQVTFEAAIVSQEQKTYSSVVSRNLVNDVSQRKSEPQISFTFGDFPSSERGSVKRPMSSSGPAWSNSSALHAPPGIPIPGEVKPELGVISAQPSSSVNFSSSQRPEQCERSPTPSPAIENFQTDGMTRMTSAHVDQSTGLNNRVTIPEKVFVVCDHFLSRRSTGDYKQTKTCKFCEGRGILKYAVWNDINHYWQEVRPFPAYKVPPKVILDLCRHFATNRPCPKEPCSFPHGELEMHMWTLEREGRLPNPEETLRMLRSTNINPEVSQPMAQEINIKKIPLQTATDREDGSMMSSFRNSATNVFPGFGTVSSQSTITSHPWNNTSNLWSGKPSTPNPSPAKRSINTISPFASCAPHMETERTPRAVPPSPIPDIMTPQVAFVGDVSSNSPAEEKEATETYSKPASPPAIDPEVHPLGDVLSQNVAAGISKSPSVFAWSSPLEASTPIQSSAQSANKTPQVVIKEAVSYQSCTAESSTISNSVTWSSRLKAPGRPSTPVSMTTAVPSSNSINDYRKIPKGVYVVCDHFLLENRNRAASKFEKTKACKGCDNRSKLKYAFWSDIWKQWELIRPYPEKVPVNVAFKECRQYSTNILCLKTPCAFAHGQQELIMWTLEREKVLPSPRETLTGSSGSKTAISNEMSSTNQNQAQLLYRPSPPGVTNGSYRLCRSCYTHERCRFGRGCILAHSGEELNEWKQEYDRKEKEKLRENIKEREEVCSLEMASRILKGPLEDRVEYLPGIEVTCTPPELNAKLQDKKQCQWTFTLIFKPNEVGYLQHVLLLHRYHSCYHLSEIRVGCFQETHGSESYKLCYSAKLKDSWYKSPNTSLAGRVKVSLTVSFESSLFGSFDQSVLFDFGKKPYLEQKLNADVMSESLSQTNSIQEHVVMPASAIWNESTMEVVRFVHQTSEALQAEHLSRTYSLPTEVEIPDEVLNPKIYQKVMHQLLFVEEGFMREEISRYTLNNAQLHAQWNIFDDMTGMKCAVDGELFGVLHLQEEDALRPDDAAGRLLYRNVNSVWLQLANSESTKVYEAPVEKVESECVVLRLPSKLCSDLDLHDTCDAAVNAQFQLNRWPLCQMHAAVDRLTSGQLRLIFPDPTVGTVISEVKIRWQWLLDKRLNPNQKKVIERIASREDNALPLVVFGPFGTGKTFTLHQAVRLLVQLDKSHRILLCTHSNRAADIHVELLHEYLTTMNGIPAARPLRVYQPMRRLETASPTARMYCLIKDDMFLLPSRDDVVEHRVVVTTLSTSQVLLDLDVLHGFFTHILIDEAAQALEPEALTALKFAGTNTKVVFTGDHMQMSPEVYSPQARSLGLQKSLAERLFDLYYKHEAEESKNNPNLKEESNVLFLTENYRCHDDILKFPSDNFYGRKLVARGHDSQPAHPNYGPLLFFSARGKEIKEQDNSYINLSEVYEVEKRVKEIANSWPTIWGPKKLSDIAVLSSYRYQVQAIRNSLRKERDLKDVKVDTIHNVQGEEFRVLFISTVRTFHTCKPQQDELRSSGLDRQLYWEFLSDPKLLNTAVTRARCLVAVVGDPVSLCTVGECRGLWRDYIKRCNKKGGLYGTTMEELDREINASIANVQLNPTAQAFVPTFISNMEKSSVAVVIEEKKAESAQEDTKDRRQVKNTEEVLKTESDAQESSRQQEMNERSTQNDSLDSKHAPCLNSKDQDQDEKEADDDIAESSDFQDNLLEDETVFPRDMDEIILAFVRKCEETLQMDAECKSVFDNSEFPSLQAAKGIKQQPIEQVQHATFKGAADIKDLFPEVRVVNGRVEVRLTNLGFYSSPSERAKRIMISSKQQDFLDPSVLMKLIEDEPQKYIVCNLRLIPEKSQVGYAEIEDTKTPAIHIKGRIRQAFDRDKVVIELAEKKARSKVDGNEPAVQGRVIGVLEHIISPHERQFVCTTDYENPALMVPINKSVTKLVNLTDKSCKDIPIYKKDHNERVTKVRMMKREKVLSGKYLFVVKYLQWRRDFRCPLGIVVRTLSRGEDLKSSMEIAYAEHGVRRVFKEETIKYVKEKFPPEWSIPEEEHNNRTKIFEAITIDPPTSLDLDDALTIGNASPSTFVVGIHIADVSFFVTPNTPLDDEAFIRCTSYYPAEGQESVPMLPRQLSENVCSLLPNEDRLAVSVFATLDEEGRLIGEPKIERTIVRSCCRLNYAEAQMIIHEHESNITETPEEIKWRIRQLSSLAQKRRFLRLGDRAFDHWQHGGKDFEAHELVEEWMILANQEIAKRLSQKNSEVAPLRIQLPPKDHRLAEWIQMHGKYARLSLTLSGMFKEEGTNTSPLKALHDENTTLKIQKSVWNAICQAAESHDIPRLHHLICNENNHPQIAAAMSHFRRIQSESRYVCEGDQLPENIYHYSLGIPRYTNFTSPIRRYIDVVVHRLLLGLGLISGSSYSGNLPDKDEITKVCRRSTFMSDNARKFDKNCKRIHMATQLQQRSRETRVFIESIEHQSISLQIFNQEDDHLASKNKRIALSHLNLVSLEEKEKIQGEEKSIVLKWKFRKYVAPDSKRNTTELCNAEYSGIDEVVGISSEIWLCVLDTVRADDGEKLITTIKQAKAKLSIMPSKHGKDKSAQTTSTDHVRGIHYKHPHHDDEAAPSSEGTVDHFYEKIVTLRKYDFVSVQLCPHMTKGILQPDIQIFKIDAHLNICIEHRKYPRESFSHTARHQASRERYGSIDEYIQAWKPVLAMEAATGAVKENDGFTIENLNVTWKRKVDSAKGSFQLTSSYCDSRQLDFYMGDLVCIRTSYSEMSPPCGDNESQKKPCQENLHSDKKRSASDSWVAHCIIKNVTFEKETRMVKVKMYLHQSASTIPEGLSNEKRYRSTLELIHRTLPQRRMYKALCSLEDSSELAHAICKGEEPSKEHYGELPSSLVLMQYGFQRLNRYQEAAVKEALSNPFTLIQGPPGTGKTVTGVHIAYWFAERNKRKKSYKALEKETGETECVGAYKSPPQVMYCGPSNKSVDVVTELLLRIPDLKVLRVYSDQIEQKEFPIPNKLKPARTSRSDDELKISSDKVRSVSLHHVIRGPGCPYSQDLRQYEEGFAQSKAMGEKIGQKEVVEYCKIIGLAEMWALQESGVKIILCTCAASGSPRIASSCDNVQQCIVDECGMCMEPESLVPITCSRARQVVLIGDHKQLQPVIQDHVAKTLGLSVSMFERHSKRATMLELQYRMHDGICEFPSRQFYGGKLRTAEVVKSRAPSPVSFWPAQVRRERNLPIVFCHVEGQEESSAIATSESNEESKRNMKEVHKAVQVAKHLVNRYRSQVRMSDVVILSPYREQRSKITELLKGAYESIQVTTITKSQGSEWDYVIISLVRSLKRDEIDPEPSFSWLREHLGFLTDEHQMNVGLTRARRGLCIIGNKYLLGMDPMWKSLLQHYEENGCLVDEAWPWPVNN